MRTLTMTLMDREENSRFVYQEQKVIPIEQIAKLHPDVANALLLEELHKLEDALARQPRSAVVDPEGDARNMVFFERPAQPQTPNTGGTYQTITPAQQPPAPYTQLRPLNQAAAQFQTAQQLRDLHQQARAPGNLTGEWRLLTDNTPTPIRPEWRLPQADNTPPPIRPTIEENPPQAQEQEPPF